MRDLVWRLTGWDFAVIRHPGSPWLRPKTWSVSGERIVDAGRCRLTVTPPWRRRARAMRAEQARNPAWQVQGAAESAAIEAAEAAPEAGRRQHARPGK